MKQCKNCYGKGYSTEFVGDTTLEPDFIGDKRITLRKGGIRIHYCKCGRGKDLRKYFSVKKKYR